MQMENKMRNKLIIAALAILSLLFCFAFTAAAETEPGEAESAIIYTEDSSLLPIVTATVSGQEIKTSAVGGEYYLFLPSSTDLSALKLNFTTTAEKVCLYNGSLGDDISASTVDVPENAAEADGVYTLTLRAINEGEDADTVTYAELTLKIMKSANIGAMFIKTEDKAYGRSWVDSSADHSNDAGKKTTVTMYMENAAGKKVYDNALSSWKGRGNSTWGCALKKPYQIKLDKKTDLLESGNDDNKCKTWILLANAFDRTLWKNALAFDLAQYLGLNSSPEYTYVDFYTDGEYRGNYIVCEKVQINSGRVEINDLEEINVVEDKSATAQGTNKYGCIYQYNPTASVPEGTDISGGYIVELDGAYYAKENSWFQVRLGGTYWYFVVKSPECATKEELIYISEYFFEAFHAMRDGKCSYTGKDLDYYADVDSIAAMYILNEYTYNIDYIASSSYYFLPESGNKNYEHKVYAGPAWDFDTALGTRTDQNYSHKWMRDATNATYWINRIIFKAPEIQQAIGEKAKIVNGLYDIIFSETPLHDEQTGLYSLSYYNDFLDASQKMNYTIWDFSETANTFCYPTYKENTDYATEFLRTRHNVVLPKMMALAPESVEYLPGDVDGDNTVSVADARLALRAAISLENEGLDLGNKESREFLAADADGNGEIKVDDARLILRVAIGLEKLGLPE